MHDLFAKADLICTLTSGLIGFLLGYALVRVATRKQIALLTKHMNRDFASSNAADRSAYLGVLRREIANELIKRGPRKYLDNYLYLLDEKRKIAGLTAKEALIRSLAISQDYKLYKDFDIVEARDYVLYSDKLDWRNDDELIRAYNNIITFSLLQEKIDSQWEGKVPGIDETELEYLMEYLSRIRDTIFLAHLRRAQRDYENYMATAPDILAYENIDYFVRPIPAMPEIAHGVHIKETSEYGVYSEFYDEKIFRSYYRSDETFKNRIPLHALTIPYCITEKTSP